MAAVAEKDDDTKQQVDRNAGLTGGWLYVVIVGKGESAWLTGWLERYFDEEPHERHQ